ncbi:MAG TPA: 50S ribosomal protein L11 methyltransferase [Thermaerobacter sp.]
MRWLEMTIDVPPHAAEAAAAAILDVVEAGLAWETRGDLVRLRAYLPEEDFEARYRALGERWRGVRQAFPAVGPWAPAVRAIREEEWADAWKQYFHPIRVGRRLLVVPSWRLDDAPPAPDQVRLVLDPGMAFGTGQHASTRLALEMVERAVEEGARAVLDVGTGSGILAIAAALLGAERVTAIDIDSAAVRVARENAESNGVAARIEVLPAAPEDLLRTADGAAADAGGGAGEPARPGLPADLTVANITAEVLAGMATHLDRLTRPEGRIALSGLVAGASGTEDVVRRYAELGWQVEERREAEGWVALLLRRAGDAGRGR